MSVGVVLQHSFSISVDFSHTHSEDRAVLFVLSKPTIDWQQAKVGKKQRVENSTGPSHSLREGRYLVAFVEL